MTLLKFRNYLIIIISGEDGYFNAETEIKKGN